MIVTDRPLDPIMETRPPAGDPLKTTTPRGIVLPDGRTVIPQCWRPRLVCGPVDVVDWTTDSRRDRLNECLGTDVDWMFYLTADDIAGRRFTLGDLMFVYRYLSEFDGMIGLVSEFNQILFPEMPVARIDISTKGPGMKPLRWPPVFDVLYLFSDSERTSIRCDTSIMDMMGRDIEEPRGCWSPADETRLEKLIEVCGNFVAGYVVYDAADERLSGRMGPVEVISGSLDSGVTSDHFGGQDPCGGDIAHAGCRVLRYGLFGYGHMDFLVNMGLDAPGPVDNDYVYMAVIVDSDAGR